VRMVPIGVNLRVGSEEEDNYSTITACPSAVTPQV
jgi:hypothetical protein